MLPVDRDRRGHRESDDVYERVRVTLGGVGPLSARSASDALANASRFGYGLSVTNSVTKLPGML